MRNYGVNPQNDIIDNMTSKHDSYSGMRSNLVIFNRDANKLWKTEWDSVDEALSLMVKSDTCAYDFPIAKIDEIEAARCGDQEYDSIERFMIHESKSILDLDTAQGVYDQLTRIMKNTSIHYRAWTQRYRWLNADGSHRMSALISFLQRERLNMSFQFNCYNFYLNREPIETLYEMSSLYSPANSESFSLLYEFLDSIRAPYGCIKVSSQFSSNKHEDTPLIIILNRKNGILANDFLRKRYSEFEMTSQLKRLAKRQKLPLFSSYLPLQAASCHEPRDSDMNQFEDFQRDRVRTRHSTF